MASRMLRLAIRNNARRSLVQEKCCVSSSRRPNQGRGLIAITTIQAGDDIFEEQPILEINWDFMHNTPTVQREKDIAEIVEGDVKIHKALMVLGNDHPQWSGPPAAPGRHQPVETPITGRILTNAIPLAADDGEEKADLLGVFSIMSHVNHSCEPNASQHWVEDRGLVLMALRKIKPQEQITISYNINSLPDVAFLGSVYGFICTCTRCTRGSTNSSSPTPSPVPSAAGPVIQGKNDDEFDENASITGEYKSDWEYEYDDTQYYKYKNKVLQTGDETPSPGSEYGGLHQGVEKMGRTKGREISQSPGSAGRRVRSTSDVGALGAGERGSGGMGHVVTRVCTRGRGTSGSGFGGSSTMGHSTRGGSTRGSGASGGMEDVPRGSSSTSGARRPATRKPVMWSSDVEDEFF